MKELIKGILNGVDGQPSSKRVAMLWLIFVVWSFVHVAVFFLIRPYPSETASTLILYDLILITALGGMNVSERIWDKTDKDKTTTNDTTKTN